MSDLTEGDIHAGEFEDLMPDLDGEKYQTIKESIADEGQRYPITVTKDGEIVDGHHRYKACQELGVGVDFDIKEDPKPEDGIRMNFERRNVNDGTKKRVVRSYLEDYYEEERTQEEIANNLGVSQPTVSKALSDIRGGENQYSTNTEANTASDTQPGESETEDESEVGVDSPNPDADTEETPDETPTTESPEGVVWDSDETEPIDETTSTEEDPGPEPDNSPSADGESFPRSVKPDKPEGQATFEIGVLHVDTSTDFVDSAEEFVEKLKTAHGYAGTSIGTKQRRQERILVELLEVVEVPE